MKDFIKKSALKDYITSLQIRINQTAFDDLIKYITTLTQTITEKSKQLAQEDKRSTIMPKDIAAVTGKKEPTWQEVAQEVIQQGPIELGNISQTIDKYIAEQKP